ncbi:hypothetical protein C789_487 [Microcystis aeruginosa FACHB-905 = DIANCHI905]|nr:hypothetical protein C789_487 [Microcystis aeruginosa FACHB-905 = DIANCHI905]
MKRMNGNPNIFRNGKHFWVTCFQFVKRMNGNPPCHGKELVVGGLASNS